MERTLAHLLILAGLVSSFSGCSCSDAEARGPRVRRFALTGTVAGAADAGTPDMGFVDAGDCPPDCGVLTDEYAANLEGDGYFALDYSFVDHLTNLEFAAVAFCLRNAAWVGTEELISEYLSTDRRSWLFFLSATEGWSAGAPNTDAGATASRANTGGDAAVTMPLCGCMAFDMRSSNTTNASKVGFHLSWDGGWHSPPKYSAGNTMGASIRDAGGYQLSVGARGTSDGGTNRATLALSELYLIDGEFTQADCQALFIYSADAGPRVIDPRGHPKAESFVHGYRFGDSACDDYWDGGVTVCDTIGNNDLTMVGPIERTGWTQ